MILEAAVEAAAEALALIADPWGKWGDQTASYHRGYMRQVASILEAAAPHMNKSGAILTPCCDAPISVSVGGFSGEIEIYCPADGCYRTWNDAGAPE